MWPNSYPLQRFIIWHFITLIFFKTFSPSKLLNYANTMYVETKCEINKSDRRISKIWKMSQPPIKRVPPPPPPGFGDEDYYRLYGDPEEYHRKRQNYEKNRSLSPDQEPAPSRRQHHSRNPPEDDQEEYYYYRRSRLTPFEISLNQ